MASPDFSLDSALFFFDAEREPRVEPIVERVGALVATHARVQDGREVRHLV